MVFLGNQREVSLNFTTYAVNHICATALESAEKQWPLLPVGRALLDRIRSISGTFCIVRDFVKSTVPSLEPLPSDPTDSR